MNTVGRHLACALSIGLCLAWATQARAAWVSKTAIPAPVDSAAIESVDGIVYVVGGYNSHLPNFSNVLSSVYAYDPTTNSWTTKASLPGLRFLGNGAAVINGQLYVAGGWTQINPPLPHSDLFVYNPPTNTWTSKASLSHLSGCGASGAIRGKLYVTTACNGFSGFFNLLDVYDPVSNSWASLAGSNSPHSAPAFGVINDKLYVAGGQDGIGNEITNVLEVYDPLTNAWTTLAPMPTAVFGPASVALNGQLFVIGGLINTTTATQIVQVYDPHTNIWHSLSGPALSFASAAVAYGILFFEGGRNPNTSIGTVSTQLDLVLTPSIP